MQEEDYGSWTQDWNQRLYTLELQDQNARKPIRSQDYRLGTWNKRRTQNYGLKTDIVRETRGVTKIT